MKKKLRSFLGAVLAIGMAFTSIPAMAATTGAPALLAETEESDGGLVLHKTAYLEDDGTYTINLDAYATGETQIVTSQEPVDIVLVLDVSGSMRDNVTYTTYNYTPTTVRIGAAPSDDLYHKCDNETYSSIRWTRTGNNVYGNYYTGTYTYVCNNCGVSNTIRLTASNARVPESWNLNTRSVASTTTKTKIADLQDAASQFIDEVASKNAAVPAEKMHRISIVKFAGERTSNEVGNDKYTDTYTYNYTQVVDNLTYVTGDNTQKLKDDINALSPDGSTASEMGFALANNVLTNQGSADRNQIVIFFTDGVPTHGNSFENSVASSAVTNAKTMKDRGVTIFSIGVLEGANANDTDTNYNKFLNAVSSNYPSATVTNANNFRVTLGQGGNEGYYKTFNAISELSSIFKQISESVGSTTVSLDENSITRDFMEEGFVLTENSAVTAHSIKYSGRNSAGERVFESTGTTLQATVDENVVSVSGFDYAGNFLLDGDTVDANNFRAAQQGKKLSITITGVEAVPEAATGNLINTNRIQSGIYQNAEADSPSAVFPQPKTELSSKVYVLDYAKEATLTDMPNTVTHVAMGMNQFSNPQATLEMDYGKATTTTYKPMTTLWDGYDTYFGFGKWKTVPEGVTTGDNTWTKISVLPANNVYYEDTFTTENDATVGIVYTGDWTTVAEGSNRADVKEDVHGWITSMNDDTTYSDGTVSTGGKGAVAQFTFTGTGVDIYSKTDISTGVVTARLYNGENTTAAANLKKSLTIDNLSQAGDYYQIPTVTFDKLDYGTYTVKLTVAATTKVTNTTRSTYYLDGIRVYNPLSGDMQKDIVVKDAYKDELGAFFTEVRDILLDSNSDSLNKGVVYIDYIPEEGEAKESAAVGTFKDYGPKNEVYLDTNNALGFQVTAEIEKITVGLKAPNGTTTVQVSNGSQTSPIEITAASDMYYVVKPDSNGNILIKNTGDNLLSVTKVKISDSGSDYDLFNLNMASLMSYANEFSSLPVTTYSLMNEATNDKPESNTTNIATDSKPSGNKNNVTDSKPSSNKNNVVVTNPSQNGASNASSGNSSNKNNSANNPLSKLFGGLGLVFGR